MIETNAQETENRHLHGLSYVSYVSTLYFILFY